MSYSQIKWGLSSQHETYNTWIKKHLGEGTIFYRYHVSVAPESVTINKFIIPDKFVIFSPCKLQVLMRVRRLGVETSSVRLSWRFCQSFFGGDKIAANFRGLTYLHENWIEEMSIWSRRIFPCRTANERCEFSYRFEDQPQGAPVRRGLFVYLRLENDV